MPRIYVDADACPVKDEVYRVARRTHLPVTLVAAQSMRVPREFTLEVVPAGVDAADDWIAAHVQPNDVVVTADIPLASRCVTAGAHALSPTGRIWTETNIGDDVATRDLLTDLRDAGAITGGPAPFTDRDRSTFLQRLDQVVQRAIRETG